MDCRRFASGGVWNQRELIAFRVNGRGYGAKLMWHLDHREELAQAQWHVARGICRVSEQRARLEYLRYSGNPIDQADEFLRLLEQTLKLMLRHRDMLERPEIRLGRRQR